MEFKEAFEAAKSGRVILSPEDEIEVILNNDLWYTLENKKVDFKPESYALDTWEVKPEEIYVWGVCDGIGTSLLFQSKPSKNPDWGADGGIIVLSHKNDLFSSREPQKYKLVPVED